ncbi:MAG: T9SS type A sorting domain-containing protein [Bacteroidetes bacterium]|nr:T9SS type A sorting domain-containing protein [Bacteroidota bacterium]
MKNKKVKLFTLFLLILGLSGLQAQQALPTTGGNAQGTGGSASYSVGQVVYTTNTGTNGSVAQGVTFTAYPNPTTDYLILRIEEYNNPDLSYQLFDINGKILDTHKITIGETTIAMSNFVAGTYILKITNNNQEVKSFKIIKNQTL